MGETTLQPGLAPLARAPGGGESARADVLRHAAQEFEAIFLAQVLGSMSQGLGEDGLLGGAQGDVFRDMWNHEIAKLISRTGGIGVADAVLREMLKAQEAT